MKRALGPRSLALCLLAAVLAAASACRSRAEFRRGEDHYQAGEFRQAYYHFWRAYRESPDSESLAALRLAGRRVAQAERARGWGAEDHGDPALALEAYALALEYDPAWADLAEDYARAWETLGAWIALSGELAGAGKEDERDPWAELDVLLHLALRPGLPGPSREDLAAAAARAGAAAAAPLARAAAADPWPPAEDAIFALEAACLQAIDDGERRLAAEEDGFFADDQRGREVASWGALREGLGAHLERAKAALEAIAPAADAVRFRERGRVLECEGDLAGAIAAYERAIASCPRFIPAREARERAVEKFTAESHRAAVAAAGRKDWAAAMARLDLLLRFDPGHAPARQLRDLARREAAALHAAEARRAEAAGLVGKALVRYYLALELAPDDASIRNAIRKLEEPLYARGRPRWQVTIRAVDAGERRVRRDLWSVDEESIHRLERDLVAGAAARRNAASGAARPGSPARAERAAVVIEDLDFSYPRGARTRGIEMARYVESVGLVPNPERAAAEARLARARADLDLALALEDAAPIYRRAAAVARVRLARERAEEAAASLAPIAKDVVATSWGRVSYPTERVDLRVELACRYGFGGENRWATAGLDLEDRIVKGEPARSVLPDPEELPSRAEALRILGERLAEALARDAARVLDAQQVRRFHEGVARIASRSIDPAVEDLTAFLYARRGRNGEGNDPLAQEAARKLLAVTGCDLPRSWRLTEG